MVHRYFGTSAPRLAKGPDGSLHLPTIDSLEAPGALVSSPACITRHLSTRDVSRYLLRLVGVGLLVGRVGWICVCECGQVGQRHGHGRGSRLSRLVFRTSDYARIQHANKFLPQAKTRHTLIYSQAHAQQRQDTQDKTRRGEARRGWRGLGLGLAAQCVWLETGWYGVRYLCAYSCLQSTVWGAEWGRPCASQVVLLTGLGPPLYLA